MDGRPRRPRPYTPAPPLATPPLPAAPPVTFFVPLSTPPPTALPQEPKATTDTPTSPVPGGPAPAPGTTQAPGTPAATPSGLPCGIDQPTMLMIALMFGVLYFVMIRPENKRRKQQQQMLSAIKAGDHVVTLGGMHGTVASLTEKTVTLRIDTQKVVFDRTAIARVERDEQKAPDTKG